VGCPIEIPSGQTPGSSLDAYAVEGERARKKKEVIKVTELRSICTGISIRKRSACMHTYICARARVPPAEGNAAMYAHSSRTGKGREAAGSFASHVSV